jgi:hypothetical protein
MGGAGGELAPEDAAAGLLQVIDGVGDADSGHFLDWRGQPVAW